MASLTPNAAPAGVVGTSTKTPVHELPVVYQLDDTVSWIKQNNFSRVALQFPDELLADATRVEAYLKKETQCTLFVLADTSYGSCCVDEVAAQHLNADAIVHYGNACLASTQRLPVKYIFGRSILEEDRFISAFSGKFGPEDKIIVFHDPKFAYAIPSLERKVTAAFKKVVFAYLRTEDGLTVSQDSCETTTGVLEIGEGVCEVGGERFAVPLSDIGEYSVVYIGGEGNRLNNLIMVMTRCEVVTYNEASGAIRTEGPSVNRALMKRYVLIEKAKHVSIIGILVGTLGVANYLKVIDHLKRIITKAGKKAYVVCVGKLNVAKLANFAEIDMFVIVACPENTLIDSKEFYRPIVTPYELEIAFGIREWTGTSYVTEFGRLCNTFDGDSLDDAPTEEDVSEGMGEVILREQMGALSTIMPTASHLQAREWKGLEVRAGETEVVKAKEGREGIAMGYTHEEH